MALEKIKIQGKKDDRAKSIKAFRKAWNKYIHSYERQLRNLHRGMGGEMRHVIGDKICETISGKKSRVVYSESSFSLKISRRKNNFEM